MKSKLTIHQQIAIRDAEEDPQPKKRAFGGKKQYYYVKGFKVNKEIWLAQLSAEDPVTRFTVEDLKKLEIKQ